MRVRVGNGEREGTQQIIEHTVLQSFLLEYTIEDKAKGLERTNHHLSWFGIWGGGVELGSEKQEGGCQSVRVKGWDGGNRKGGEFQDRQKVQSTKKHAGEISWQVRGAASSMGKGQRGAYGTQAEGKMGRLARASRPRGLKAVLRKMYFIYPVRFRSRPGCGEERAKRKKEPTHLWCTYRKGDKT